MRQHYPGRANFGYRSVSSGRIRRLPLADVVEGEEGSGQSYRKRDVGCKAAKCIEGHGYIYIYILFILTNDQISGDRR